MVKIILPICFVLLAWTQIYGQVNPVKIIEIDTIAEQPVEAIPFDQAFYLRKRMPVSLNPVGYSISAVNKKGNYIFKKKVSKKREPTSTTPAFDDITDMNNYIHKKKSSDNKSQPPKSINDENQLIKSIDREFKLKYLSQPTRFEIDPRMQRIASKTKKDVFFHFEQLEPSVDYKLAINYANSDFVNHLLEVINLITTITEENDKKAEKKYLEYNLNKVGIPSWNEFKTLINASKLDLSSIDTLKNKLMIFIRRIDVPFTSQKITELKECYQIKTMYDHVFQQTVNLDNENWRNDWRKKRDFILTDKSIYPCTGQTFPEPLKDFNGSVLIAGKFYIVLAILIDKELFLDPAATRINVREFDVQESGPLYFDGKFFGRIDPKTKASTDSLLYVREKNAKILELINEVKIAGGDTSLANIEKYVKAFLTTPNPRLSIENNPIQSISERNAILLDLDNKIKKAQFKNNPVVIREAFTLFLNINCNSLLGSELCNNKEEIYNAYNNFANIKTNEINEIISGQISLNNLTKKIDELDLGARIQNIEGTLKLLEKISIQINYVLLNEKKGNADFELLKSNLESIRTFISYTSKKYLIDAKKLQDDVIEYLLKTRQLAESKSMTVTTESMTLKARASFRIVPDFGLVGVKGLSSGLSNLTPYLGFSINFRPINKDIPFRRVQNKSWRSYFSFMTGFTLTSIAITGSRHDIFSNKSILTGLGIRINNYAKISSGVVWFNQLDPNQNNGNLSLSCAPYLGLSIDLELKELFGGIESVFK